jgi:peptidoglycan/LPS O-acetylase OafA/YrhL
VGTEPAERTERIQFAHELRGVAALLVMVLHVALAFFLRPEGEAKLLNLPVYPGRAPAAIRYVGAYSPINFAHFGVALFFLISGFVIPFSFRSQRGAGFLVARAFRIIPPYALGLAVTLLSLRAATWYFGRDMPQPVGFWQVLSHVFLVRDVAAWQNLDGIVWTLEVEVKFYLLCALLAPALRRGLAWPLVPLGLACVAATGLASRVPVSFALPHPQLYNLLLVVQMTALMVPFMLIGTLANFHFRQRISGRACAALMLFLLGCFALQWRMNFLRATVRSGTYNYTAAWVVFTICYLLRNRLSPARSLSWLADVSYPVYLIHGFAGPCYLRVFLSLWDRPWVALVSCFGLVFGLATLLHHWVEVPSNRLGKRLAARLGRPAGTAAPPAATAPPAGARAA